MKTAHSSTRRFALPPATHEQITQRAHRIWIEEGRPEGRAREHWLEAERQLRDPAAKRGGGDTVSRDDVGADTRVDGLAAERRDPRAPNGGPS